MESFIARTAIRIPPVRRVAPVLGLDAAAARADAIGKDYSIRLMTKRVRPEVLFPPALGSVFVT